MRVTHVTSLTDLTSYAEAWDRLAERCPGGHPMSSAAWLVPLFQHLTDPNEQWHVFLAHENDRLVGVMPLTERRLGRLPGVIGVTAPHGTHSIASTVLIQAEGGSEIFQRLLADATQTIRSALRFELPMTLEASPAVDAAPAGYRVTRGAAVQGSFIDTRKPYAEYHASLSRNARNNLQKAANKLKRLPDVRFHCHTGPAADPMWLDAFSRVEGSGWKGRAHSAVNSSPRLMDFYRALTTNLAARHWLEWHVLEAEGQTLAANLAIRFARTVYIWKLGYHDGYRQCSPGSLLLRYVVDRACAESVDRIDLMTDFPWYSRWRMAHYPYWHLAFYPSDRWRSTAAYAAVALKRLARRSPSPTAPEDS